MIWAGRRQFFEPACAKQEKGRICKDRPCMTPDPCPALRTDHRSYLGILKKVRSLEGVKKVFIRSGIRFDTVLMDEKSNFLEEVCRHHVSGQLKVAPEHISEGTLRAMASQDLLSTRPSDSVMNRSTPDWVKSSTWCRT